jgi:hypothetical protein
LGSKNGANWEYTDYTYAYQLNTWYCLELYAKVDSSAGAYGVWLNGNQIISLTGKNSAAVGNVTSVNMGVFSDSTKLAHQVLFDAVVMGNKYNGP